MTTRPTDYEVQDAVVRFFNNVSSMVDLGHTVPMKIVLAYSRRIGRLCYAVVIVRGVRTRREYSFRSNNRAVLVASRLNPRDPLARSIVTTLRIIQGGTLKAATQAFAAVVSQARRMYRHNPRRRDLLISRLNQMAEPLRTPRTVVAR